MLFSVHMDRHLVRLLPSVPVAIICGIILQSAGDTSEGVGLVGIRRQTDKDLCLPSKFQTVCVMLFCGTIA